MKQKVKKSLFTITMWFEIMLVTGAVATVNQRFTGNSDS